VQGIQ